MFELSACIELLFAPESPEFLPRLSLAREAGFSVVEFWSFLDKDLERIGEELRRLELALHLFLVRPSGPLADAAAHGDFLDQLQEAARLAQAWGAPYLALYCGDVLDGMSMHEQEGNVLAALRAAVPIARRHDRVLLIEPLNTTVDHPGYFIGTTPRAIGLIEAVGSDRLRLAYDAYHSITMGERPEEVLGGNGAVVGHVQIADVPGRGEPGSGTVDWTAFLGWLAAEGYRGPVGLEYRPRLPTVESLAYIKRCVEVGAP
jgi:hydroxypyruvate isomerase